MAVLYVNNERWAGVPFILKSGKGLSEQKAEIRIQFKDVPGLLLNPDIARNELVIRVQPNEAVYLKMIVKRPGLGADPILSDLDLSYATRYHGIRIPEAYESLLLDVLRQDQSNFVRGDELEAAWRIFTPVLRRIEQEHVMPVIYPFGSRGPDAADALIERLGYRRHVMQYGWPGHNSSRETLETQ
jgi:glucose-6-phosphate 1-dehydrogenase